MNIRDIDSIVAIVTTNKEKVSSGSVPTFYADDIEEQKKVSLLIAKLFAGMVHDIENGCYLIVKH